MRWQASCKLASFIIEGEETLEALPWPPAVPISAGLIDTQCSNKHPVSSIPLRRSDKVERS